MKKLILLSLLQVICLNLSAQEVKKETHLYSIKGTDTLLLDRYYTDGYPEECAEACPKTCSEECSKTCSEECPKTCAETCPKTCAEECPKTCAEKCPKKCTKTSPETCPEMCTNSQELKPAIIFMFGGAFYTGKRDEERFISCFEYYARSGYEVFSIDYRLGLKDVALEGVKPISKLLDTIQYTIDIAVEDLYDATSYIVDMSETWGVDPSMIVSFGSSAGAVSVLQAEYYRVNGHKLASKLPNKFKYKGVIGMAGAIFSTSGKLKWRSDVAPILMFQGSADRNIPYDSKQVFKYGLFGSKAITKSLKKIDSPYYFVTFEGAGHEIALTPMNENREDIDAFLDKLVKKSLPLEITTSSVNTTKPKVKDRFSIKDYINANYSQQ